MSRISLLVSTVVCLVLPFALWAQDPVGVIEGLVTDKSTGPVSAAQVTRKNLDTGLKREVSTEKSGLFRIPFLAVGRYSVTVVAPHFAKLVQQPILINVSQTKRIDLQLDVAAVIP